jgi:hypothetical protein
VTTLEPGGDLVTFCGPSRHPSHPIDSPPFRHGRSPEAAPEDTHATRAGQDNAPHAPTLDSAPNLNDGLLRQLG